MKKLICILCAVCFSLAVPFHAGANAAGADKSPAFSATFLQNWICHDWTQERWIREFSDAEDAGFDAIILQSVYDIVRGSCAAGGNEQDAAAYPTAESFCMFPSQQTADYHSAQNSGDALQLALEAAKETGMQLWIGTINDDLWWKYGWGIPEGGYFKEWSVSNAAQCAALIREIWTRYGNEYGGQIAGWYYVNEIWNLDAACDGSDCGAYAEIIRDNIRASVQAVAECCPEKPILISPFYNPDISSAAGYTAFLTEVLREFRPIDIYAGQDGGGKEYPPAVIREWTLAQKEAVSGRMRFWINHECFNADFSPKSIEALRENYNAAADLADGHILFSWNHYYAPNSELNAQFRAFAAQRIPGDVNADGVFSISDAVLLQKWLTTEPQTALSDWQAADFSHDGILNAHDLSLMKQSLLANKNLEVL